MIEKDYIMRMIYEVIRTLLRLLFQLDIDSPNGALFEDEARMERYRKLTGMIDDGEINEAENLLLEDLNAVNMKDYELALRFYAYLNEKENDFLEAHGFSREEVAEGLKLTGQIFGYRSMVESLMEELDEVEE